jgi:TolA-binding protein
VKLHRPLLRSPSPELRKAPDENTAPVENDPTAADLFARANRLRRSDQAVQAARGYRDLQKAFPGSSEELVSRVSLGRLLLDRLGDSGGALAQFDSYLASPAQGALREEALIGRALSLGRLGRTAEERTTWNALLSAYPRSTYAARARERIGGSPTK